MAKVSKPISRKEIYYSYLLGDKEVSLPKPITREEQYLYAICQQTQGGMSQEQADARYALKENTVIGSSLSMNRKADSEIGENSVALGYNCNAEGENSFAFGYKCEALGECSHAEGYNTYADELKGAHAEGYYTRAEREGCHAEGCLTRARGEGCHVEGYYTRASARCLHVEGRYNSNYGTDPYEYGKYVHIVGNGKGDADSQRSNAHTLDWEGNAEYAGDVIANGCGGNAPISLVKIAKEIEEKGGGVPTDHASTEKTYGVGDNTHFGHLKLTDEVVMYDTAYGYAATPKAVVHALTEADAAYNYARGEVAYINGRIDEIQKSSYAQIIWDGDKTGNFSVELTMYISEEIAKVANIFLLINGYWENVVNGEKLYVSAAHIVGFTRDENDYGRTNLYFAENMISDTATAYIKIVLFPNSIQIDVTENTAFTYHVTNIGIIGKAQEKEI